MTTDATLPAAVPLRLPPRSAYATPSSKSSKSTQRLKSSLTYYPIRPFAPLHVCMEDLTADIFHWVDAVEFFDLKSRAFNAAAKTTQGEEPEMSSVKDAFVLILEVRFEKDFLHDADVPDIRNRYHQGASGT